MSVCGVFGFDVGQDLSWRWLARTSPGLRSFTSLREGREVSLSELTRGGLILEAGLQWYCALPDGSSLALDPPGGRVKSRKLIPNRWERSRLATAYRSRAIGMITYP